MNKTNNAGTLPPAILKGNIFVPAEEITQPQVALELAAGVPALEARPALDQHGLAAVTTPAAAEAREASQSINTELNASLHALAESDCDSALGAEGAELRITGAVAAPNETAAKANSMPVLAQEANGTDGPDAANPRTNAPSRRKRAANPSFDGIWTRNHAISLLGAIYDAAVGWPDHPRVALTPLTGGMKPKDTAEILVNLSGWLLNPVYMNFQGSSDLERYGLDDHFRSWAANRVYYFFRDLERSEHPALRAKGNLAAVYADFWKTFSSNVNSLTPISEAEAREFWLSVADRVPFQLPPKTATAEATKVEGGRH